MGNKKLIVINVLTLIAFIVVVGAGVSQSDSEMDEFGELVAIDHETIENEVGERDEVLLSHEEEETMNLSSLERKETLGAMILQNRNWSIAQVEEVEEEVELEEESAEPVVAEGSNDDSNGSHIDEEESSPREESGNGEENGNGEESKNGEGDGTSEESEKDGEDGAGGGNGSSEGSENEGNKGGDDNGNENGEETEDEHKNDEEEDSGEDDSEEEDKRQDDDDNN